MQKLPTWNFLTKRAQKLNGFNPRLEYPVNVSAVSNWTKLWNWLFKR